MFALRCAFHFMIWHNSDTQLTNILSRFIPHTNQQVKPVFLANYKVIPLVNLLFGAASITEEHRSLSNSKSYVDRWAVVVIHLSLRSGSRSSWKIRGSLVWMEHHGSLRVFSPISYMFWFTTPYNVLVWYTNTYIYIYIHAYIYIYIYVYHKHQVSLLFLNQLSYPLGSPPCIGWVFLHSGAPIVVFVGL